MTREVQQMIRDQVFEAIENERDYQNGKWGTAFDDKNTINDWTTYIARYATNAAWAQTGEDQAKQLVKVAALAVAALEALARNSGLPQRHYDSEVLAFPSDNELLSFRGTEPVVVADNPSA